MKHSIMVPTPSHSRPSALTGQQAVAIVEACNKAGLPELAQTAIQHNVSEAQLNQHLKTARELLTSPAAQQLPQLCKLVASTFGQPPPKAMLDAAEADMKAAVARVREESKQFIRLSVFEGIDLDDDIKAQVGSGAEIARIYEHRRQQGKE